MKIDILNLEIIDRRVLKRLEPIGKVFQKAIDVEKEGIKKRTQQGVDVDGASFEPYSPKHPGSNWKSVREKTGFQTAFVDLTYEGGMFNALKTVFKREGFKFLATIFFDDTKEAQKAKGHQSGQLGNVKFKARKFFGLSQTQQETIVSKIRNAK
jgi:hypothetical protein